MNKRAFKLIFSQVHAMLIAVGETARGYNHHTSSHELNSHDSKNLGITSDNEAYNGSEKVLPDRFNPDNNQYNGNHAEKKLMSHITQQNQNGSISDVKINIQNTSDEFKGACYGCGGQDGTGGSIQDFKNLNKDLKIHIEHGSTSTKP